MEEVQTNIVTPTNYSNIADLPQDLKKMAESIQIELNKKLEESNLEYFKSEISSLKETNQQQQEEIENLLSELSDKTVEGSNLNITDSAQARASIFPLGNTEQESREGYNELNLANVEVQTLQGITSTYNSENNSVTFNGTCTTDNTIFKILNNPISAVQNKTRLVIKYVSGTITGTGSNAFRLFDANWDKSMSANLLNLSSTNREIVSLFTHTDLVLSNNSFRFDSGTVLNNFTVQVMVYTSDEEKEYEQYGKSPSREFPSPIKVVSGSYETKIENEDKSLSQTKNLDFPEGIKLAGNSTVRDYIYKSGSKWYKKAYWLFFVADGTATISGINTTLENTVRFNITNVSESNLDYTSNNKCNRLIWKQMWSIDEEGFYCDDNGSSIRVRMNKDIVGTTEDEIKTYLSNNNLEFCLKLMEPIDIEITDETLISQSEELLNSETHKGVTNITTEKGSTEVADLIVKVDYKQSNQVRITELETKMNEILQLISTTSTADILISNYANDLESEV